MIALVIVFKDVELSFDKQDFTLKVFLLHNWYKLRETTKILIKICNIIHTTFFRFWSPAGEHGVSSLGVSVNQIILVTLSNPFA